MSERAEPIFLTGYQRSGTTLLGNLIDRHPRVAVFVESFFIPRYYYTQLLYWPLSDPERRLRLARAIAAEPAARANALGCDPGVVADVREPTYAALLDAMLCDWAARRGKVRWGDKSPGYISKLHVLQRMYPQARFVQIVRDGRDVWLSLRKLGWERSVVKVARDWQATLRASRRYAARHLGGRYLELRYEDLVARPEHELRRITAFIGEDYSDALLDSTQDPSRNAAFRDWPRIHDRIDPANLEKWRQELSPRELALFEAQAGGLLRELGYPCACDRIPAGVRWAARTRAAGAVLGRALDLTARGPALALRALKTRVSGS